MIKFSGNFRIMTNYNQNIKDMKMNHNIKYMKDILCVFWPKIEEGV